MYFSEFYQGVTCQVDADCDGVGTGVCHQGICAMGALEEVISLCFFAPISILLVFSDGFPFAPGGRPVFALLHSQHAFFFGILYSVSLFLIE